MDLIPITKLKISKEKWLNTPIQYEENLFIKDIVEILSQKTYHWIVSKDDIEVIQDYDSFNKEFINLLYTKYVGH
tara:strand:+ start:170 stop:394 length:225 start_codon:yes stop_codon:yes gene_type:complete